MDEVLIFWWHHHTAIHCSFPGAIALVTRHNDNRFLVNILWYKHEHRNTLQFIVQGTVIYRTRAIELLIGKLE